MVADMLLGLGCGGTREQSVSYVALSQCCVERFLQGVMRVTALPTLNFLVKWSHSFLYTVNPFLLQVSRSLNVWNSSESHAGIGAKRTIWNWLSTVPLLDRHPYFLCKHAVSNDDCDYTLTWKVKRIPDLINACVICFFSPCLEVGPSL